MSLSNPRASVKSPVNYYYQWKGKKGLGHFARYDKSTQQNVVSASPFAFIVLDTCFSIAGYSAKENSNVYSNYFRSKNEQIKVKYAKTNELIVAGTWGEEDVKDKINARGGKFCINVFIMDAEKRISCLQLTGSALGAWIEFSKHFDMRKNPLVVVSESSSEATPSGIEYEKPIFRNIRTAQPESIQQAIQLDKELQSYFQSIGLGGASIVDDVKTEEIFNNDSPMNQPQQTEPIPIAADPISEADDDLPF